VQKRNDLINERGMMLRPDAVSNWTPTAGCLPHVTELEPVDGRSWEVIKVLEHHVTRGDDVLPVWYAFLQDTSKSGSPVITPDRLSPRGERKAIKRNDKIVGHHPHPISEDGCLENHMYPTRQDAFDLCNILGDILNRFPQSLPVVN
jgi:hypothetical protein